MMKQYLRHFCSAVILGQTLANGHSPRHITNHHGRIGHNDTSSGSWTSSTPVAYYQSSAAIQPTTTSSLHSLIGPEVVKVSRDGQGDTNDHNQKPEEAQDDEDCEEEPEGKLSHERISTSPVALETSAASLISDRVSTLDSVQQTASVSAYSSVITCTAATIYYPITETVYVTVLAKSSSLRSTFLIDNVSSTDAPNRSASVTYQMPTSTWQDAYTEVPVATSYNAQTTPIIKSTDSDIPTSTRYVQKTRTLCDCDAQTTTFVGTGSVSARSNSTYAAASVANSTLHLAHYRGSQHHDHHRHHHHSAHHYEKHEHGVHEHHQHRHHHHHNVHETDSATHEPEIRPFHNSTTSTILY